MIDRRSTNPTDEIGSATTPWIFNTDVKIDKKIPSKFGTLSLFLRITNLFDRKNILNVYESTGSARNDGIIGHDVMDAFASSYNNDYNNNGIKDIIELYNSINIENGEAYRTEVSKRLYSPPRQIFVGFSISF